MKAWILPFTLACLALLAWRYRHDMREQLLDKSVTLSIDELHQTAIGLAFRQGESPSTPLVSATLRAQQAIREARSHDTAFHADVSLRLKEEWQLWQRQWENDEERRTRLANQQLNESKLESSIREKLLDEAWLEDQFATFSHPTEADLAEAYNPPHLREQWRIPHAWRVAHLFVAQNGSSRQDRSQLIENLHQKLLQGEPWATLVEAYSDDSRSKTRAGELGWMTEKRMPPEFLAALKTLKIGSTSSPIKTRLGWHLIRLLDDRSDRSAPLAEIRQELASQLASIKRQERISEWMAVRFTSTRK